MPWHADQLHKQLVKNLNLKVKSHRMDLISSQSTLAQTKANLQKNEKLEIKSCTPVCLPTRLFIATDFETNMPYIDKILQACRLQFPVCLLV